MSKIGIIADKIEQWAIDDLVPYARNAKRHPAEQIAQIAASMREFGFTIPVLVAEDGTIVAGHGRVLAASEIGLDRVPVIVARGWSDEQRRAYTLADNRLNESEWDEEMLALELGDLSDLGCSLDLLGFSDKELARLIDFAGNEGEGDPDDIPDVPEVPTSVPGDIWVLGHHRIICGDSTSPEVSATLLGDEKPHLMVTDPPYGVEYDANWRNEAARNSESMGNRALDAGAVGKVLNDDRADWREAWALFPGDVAYVWHAGLFAATVADSLTACDFLLRSQVIWAKQQFAIGRGDYHWQHEPCWYAVRKGKKGHYVGGRKQSTLWEIPKPAKSETGHSTQKPVECMLRPIENNSEPGDAVYEPFSGSGTTIIAAEMSGRRCFAIELHPAYVDVAVRRWEAFTGERAVHAADGREFAEIASERLAAEAA